MAATIPSTSTEYAANAMTITRGTAADITAVGVYHTTNAASVPAVADFTEVVLVAPGDPLADSTLPAGAYDILSLVGPRSGDVTLTPGTYQRWVLISTATEDIIRKIDTITVI